MRAREGALGSRPVQPGQCLPGPRDTDGDPARARTCSCRGAPGGQGRARGACRRRSGPAARGSACAGPRRPAPGPCGPDRRAGPSCGGRAPMRVSVAAEGPPGAPGPSAGKPFLEATCRPGSPCASPHPAPHQPCAGLDQRLVPGDRAGRRWESESEERA